MPDVSGLTCMGACQSKHYFMCTWKAFKIWQQGEFALAVLVLSLFDLICFAGRKPCLTSLAPLSQSVSIHWANHGLCKSGVWLFANFLGFAQHQGQEALGNSGPHSPHSLCKTSHVGRPELCHSPPGPPMKCQHQPVPGVNILRPQPHRLLVRFQDQLPEPPVSTDVPPTIASTVRCIFLHIFNSFQTGLNSFGIACKYQPQPMHDPDWFVSQGDLAFQPPLAAPLADCTPSWPWANMTIWHLITWVLTSSQ